MLPGDHVKRGVEPASRRCLLPGDHDERGADHEISCFWPVFATGRPHEKRCRPAFGRCLLPVDHVERGPEPAFRRCLLPGDHVKRCRAAPAFGRCLLPGDHVFVQGVKRSASLSATGPCQLLNCEAHGSSTDPLIKRYPGGVASLKIKRLH